MVARMTASPSPVSSQFARGATLHVGRQPALATTFARLALTLPAGCDGTAAAVLARHLEAACARWATRQALADRLGDLHGALLSVTVERVGAGNALVATLDWPTAGVPRAGRMLAAGLELLTEVATRPAGGKGGIFTGESFERALREQRRRFAARLDDRPREAVRRALLAAYPDEAAGAPVEGEVGGLAHVTPAHLAALHRRLLAESPLSLTIVGNEDPKRTAKVVAAQLAPALGSRKVGANLPIVAARGARARPGSRTEIEPSSQGQLVALRRAAIRPASRAALAADVLAGYLGEGGSALLFHALREARGLCYSVESFWWAFAGIHGVRLGLAPKRVPEARRALATLWRELAAGGIERPRLQAWQEERGETALGWLDRPAALASFWEEQRAALRVPDLHAAIAAWRSVQVRELVAVARRLQPDYVYVRVASRAWATKGGAKAIPARRRAVGESR